MFSKVFITGLTGFIFLTFTKSPSTAEKEVKLAGIVEARGVWMDIDGILKEAKEEGEGVEKIREIVNKFKEANFNLLLVWISSLYASAMENEKYREEVPWIKWDGLGKLVEEAHKTGIEVHFWYSPWLYKETYRATELREHPEWAEVGLDGKPLQEGICPARPEVRDYELNLILDLVKKYPKVNGIHLEEPGYSWGDYCFCPVCKGAIKKQYGFEPSEKPKEVAIGDFKAKVCGLFIARLRRELRKVNPKIILSANGSRTPGSDYGIGRDWVTWARNGWLDFYIGQNYSTEVEDFRKATVDLVKGISDCAFSYEGIGVSFSGLYPNRNPTEMLIKQVETTRVEGADGVIFFQYPVHLKDEDLVALKNSVFSEPAITPHSDKRFWAAYWSGQAGIRLYELMSSIKDSPDKMEIAKIADYEYEEAQKALRERDYFNAKWHSLNALKFCHEISK